MSARQLARDYAALSAGELLSKIAGFLAFAYLARVLAPADYGALELAVALSMVGVLVVDFGLAPVGAREVTRDPERANELVALIPAARILLSVVALAAMAICALSFGTEPRARALIALFGVGLLAAPWTLNWLFQGLERVRWVAPAQMLRMFVFAGAAVIWVREPDHLVRIGWIEVAAAAAMSAYYLWVATRQAHIAWPRFERRGLRHLMAEAAPVGVSQLLWAFNQYLPTLVIAGLLAAESIAFYGAAHRVVMSLGSFIFLYFFTLYPSLVRATSDRSGDFSELMQHSFRITAWIGVLGGLLGTLLAEPLSRLAYGDRFAASGPLLALLIWALPLNLLSGHARFSLIASGHQRKELNAQAIGVAVTLGLGLLLVPNFGAIGAAAALVTSAAVVWFVAHGYAHRLLGPLPSLGPLLRPGLAAVGAATVFAMWSLPSPWWRAGAAGALYLAVAPLLEPRLLRDLRALLRARGSSESTDAPSLP